jgi:hypothetical protein
LFHSKRKQRAREKGTTVVPFKKETTGTRERNNSCSIQKEQQAREKGTIVVPKKEQHARAKGTTVVLFKKEQHRHDM